jgi:hypothetical protein
MRVDIRLIFFRIAALMLLLLAQGSNAADLSTRKATPIAAPPVFTWTGFYVGLNFGYSWTASPSIAAGSANVLDLSAERFGLASAIGASSISNARLDGFFFGGQAGYNWQFADKLIAGFEADIQGAGVRGGGSLANVTGASTGFAVTGGKLNRPEGLPGQSLRRLSSLAQALRGPCARSRRRPPPASHQIPRPRRSPDPRRLRPAIRAPIDDRHLPAGRFQKLAHERRF